MSSGASLSGFTLKSGDDGNSGYPYGGGGVFCESVTAVLSNCVISGNRSTGLYPYTTSAGGGAYGGTLNNCTLSNNQASVRDDYTGGIFSARGGGAYGSTLNNCTLVNNSAFVFDFHSTVSNSSTPYGGGAYGCTLNNCTLTGNHASFVDFTGGGIGLWSAAGGGAYASELYNCILFGNTTQNVCEDCGCDPLFVDTNGWANLRLQSNSTCINAGNNAFAPAGPDLDGNPRIAAGTVDIGAYEFQSPVSMISYAWLQQYGLSVNSSTDTADRDGDGVDNYHEWLAGTDPTSALSSPVQLAITPSGTNVILTWSTNAIGFTLQFTTNLGSPAAWSTNSLALAVIGGQNVVTNPITGRQQLYRLSR